MGEQHNTETMPLALARKVSRWDYAKSVAKMRPLVREWRRATEEVLRELYLAREFLNGQKGQRSNPDADNYLVYTWAGYCGEIGLSYQTANNWLRPFTPRELSETGKDTLAVEPQARAETARDRARMLARVAEVLLTGERPADFTGEEEAELRRQMKNADLARLAEKYNAPAVSKARDHYPDVVRTSKSIVNFKLKDSAQIQAQFHVFSHIEAYLATFDDPATRTKAAFNLALKARNIANEIAEAHFNSIDEGAAK